ncbi:hypothetical protein [Amycolatopsis sp. YIM 10]|uniref:hypothetical protein n=1 Tax=Amycolatopsis sp. YIM 10 TaxID=2653857 RepID=UPI00129024A6|nr:hypothetical protein [Amycolatopsis sp. YIM 10]QFU89537.1 hypothetical protein YIM_21795 [Amycolatopsis sp. YIM 10]
MTEAIEDYPCDLLVGAGIAGLPRPESYEVLLAGNPDADPELGRSTGAALSAGMSGFYGHVMAYPLSKPLLPGDFPRLAQSFHSAWGIMLGPDGRRFTDESLGHYRNSQAATAALPPG